MPISNDILSVFPSLEEEDFFLNGHLVENLRNKIDILISHQYGDNIKRGWDIPIQSLCLLLTDIFTSEGEVDNLNCLEERTIRSITYLLEIIKEGLSHE